MQKFIHCGSHIRVQGGPGCMLERSDSSKLFLKCYSIIFRPWRQVSCWTLWLTVWFRPWLRHACLSTTASVQTTAKQVHLYAPFHGLFYSHHISLHTPSHVLQILCVKNVYMTFCHVYVINIISDYCEEGCINLSVHSCVVELLFGQSKCEYG